MKFASALIASVVASISATLVQAVVAPSKTLVEPRQVNKPPGVVQVSGSGFVVDGKPFIYVGTTAYWLTQLSDDDIKKTLENIASKGIKVVRTWAFHDVIDNAPSTGTYIRLWNSQTKTSTLNQAGVDKLKLIVSTAESLGLKIHFSLTNNWDPPSSNNLPKGSLSNDYGGIDTYVQVLKPNSTHDCFYTDDNIIKTFKDNAAAIITLFKDSPAIFGWELANDPRCGGGPSHPSGNDCKPETITKWTNDVAGFVKSIDPNHLCGSGDGGFFCVDCPKIFATPRPRPSHLPGQTKRDIQTIGGLPRRTGPLTRKHLWEQAVAKEKFQMKAEMRSDKFGIRGGKWQARSQAWRPKFIGKRQDSMAVGPAYTGTQGVDSDDIIAAPNIDFSSFQLFPDQNGYSPDSTTQNVGGGTGGQNLGPTINQGNEWIIQHAESASAAGKPVIMAAFGVVSQDNVNFYHPFDGTSSTLGAARKRQDASVPTVQQQVDVYTQWANTAVSNAVDGIQQYQWGQTGLGDQSSVVDNSNGHSSEQNSNGFSPDDGYGAYNGDVQNVLQNTAQSQNAATG